MKRKIIESLLLITISSFIIFFQFNQVPKKLSWDEVEFARLALSLENKPYTPYSQLATGHSTLYFYLILASIKIFGLTNFALRSPAALFGVLNVLLFFLILRQVFPKTKYFSESRFHFPFLPLLLALILISSRWYFNFARFSFEVTFLLFLELASIYSFFKFSEEKKNYQYLVICAAFSGLAFLSYYPGRIFFLLPLIFLILYSQRYNLWKNLFIFLTAFIVITSPLLIYLSTHKDLRIKEQLFLTDKKLTLNEKSSYFALNGIKLASMFTHYGDLNGRHNYPGKSTFNPLVGAFFLYGFMVTLLHYRNFYNLFFLIYFALSLLPAMFTYPAENPNSLRTYTAVIPSMFFLGNGLTYLFQSENKSRNLLLLVILLLIGLFTLSALYDLRTYFLYQKTVFNKAFELNGSIERIINLKLWEKDGFF